MTNIKLIAELDFSYNFGPKARRLFEGDRRMIVEIMLRDGDVLKRHSAAEPITVLCLSGNGTFSAGPDLSETIPLKAGTLITLDAGVEHEAAAAPDLHLLVSKFGT